MNNNQVLQKPNQERKGTLSLFLGIVSLVLIKFESLFPMILIPFIVSFFIALAGLMLGINGLKGERKVAVVGIIICMSALTLSLYFINLSIQLLKALQ